MSTVTATKRKRNRRSEKATHAIHVLCRCLEVTRRDFYVWERQPASAQAVQDRRLRVQIGASLWLLSSRSRT